MLLKAVNFQDYTDNKPARRSIYHTSNNPAMIAIANENNVPSSTYSVNRKSAELFISENLNTDFAVIKKPTAEKLWVTINVTINILSI
jgi:hypothetical protein